MSERLERLKKAGLIGCMNDKECFGEWIKFEKRKYSPFNEDAAPFDKKPFLACIWGQWVGEAIYARHCDDSSDKIPGKYEFFYVCESVEDVTWQIRLEDDPFPITHWMPLPKPPEDKE